MEKAINMTPLNVRGEEIVIIVNNASVDASTALLVEDLIESNFRVVLMRNNEHYSLEENKMESENLLHNEFSYGKDAFRPTWEEAMNASLRMRPDLIIIDDKALEFNTDMLFPVCTGHSLGVIVDESELANELTAIMQAIKINSRKSMETVKDVIKIIVYINGEKEEYSSKIERINA